MEGSPVATSHESLSGIDRMGCKPSVLCLGILATIANSRCGLRRGLRDSLDNIPEGANAYSAHVVRAIRVRASSDLAEAKPLEPSASLDNQPKICLT